MSHSVTRIWVHVIWCTYYRERSLAGGLAKLMEEHLRAYALERQIRVQRLAVQPEHVHCLLELSPTQRLDEVVQLLKGESSHWLNHQRLLRGRFSWARGYWAGSVDRRGVDVVQKYIEGQDEHHRTSAFSEEAKRLLAKLGLDPGLAEESS